MELFTSKNWYDYLCEYYEVSPQKALELGTRSSGRKPNLPGSRTTHPVSDMTFEQIWSLKERKKEEEIFQFYKDQGAWSSFRQVVRHKDMTNFHLSLMSNMITEKSTFCEYGCGVAPFTHTLLSNLSPESHLTIYLSDVDCEHFSFGVWRINRLVESRGLKNITVKPVVIEPGKMPQYDQKLDTVMVFEVLEHVPSPLSVVKNMHDHLNPEGLFCENFIKHDHHDDDGPDLRSAAEERNSYYDFLDTNFERIGGNPEKDYPNETRIWKKR